MTEAGVQKSHMEPKATGQRLQGQRKGTKNEQPTQRATQTKQTHTCGAERHAARSRPTMCMRMRGARRHELWL